MLQNIHFFHLEKPLTDITFFFLPEVFDSKINVFEIPDKEKKSAFVFFFAHQPQLIKYCVKNLHRKPECDIRFDFHAVKPESDGAVVFIDCFVKIKKVHFTS